MRIFWKYFVQGFGYYFNASDVDSRVEIYSMNYCNSYDRFMCDFQAVSKDFTKVYNKITEINK